MDGWMGAVESRLRSTTTWKGVQNNFTIEKLMNRMDSLREQLKLANESNKRLNRELEEARTTSDDDSATEFVLERRLKDIEMLQKENRGQRGLQELADGSIKRLKSELLKITAEKDELEDAFDEVKYDLEDAQEALDEAKKASTGEPSSFDIGSQVGGRVAEIVSISEQMRNW